MKHCKIFVGTLLAYEHLNCSVYGNPAFKATFIDSLGNTLSGRTASDAACAYGFLNEIKNAREIKYHVTRNGNVIFDYIIILKKGVADGK